MMTLQASRLPQPSQVLDRDQCLLLLTHRHLGRIAFLDNGVVTILPVNYIFYDDVIVFRTDAGSKLEAALRGDQVAFEIDGVNAEERSGWSVIARGQARRVSDPAELEKLQALPLISWAPGIKSHHIKIHVTEMTGRRISSAGLPSDWWG